MNIPAPDAISLDPHIHNSSRRDGRRRPSISMTSRRSLTRSTSPKVIFASSLSSFDGPKAGRNSSLRHPPSGSFDGGPNGHRHLHDLREDVDNADVRTWPGDAVNRETDGKKKSVDWEIPRKLFHSSIGFIVIPLYTSHQSPQKVVIVLSVACAIITAVDFIRLRNPRFAMTYERFLGFLMRESEKHKTNGVIWYLLGCTFVLSAYPLDIAVVSILILSWCDTTASIFGRLFGPRTRPLPDTLHIPFTTFRLPLFARRKSLAGFIAAATTGSLITFTFWHWLAPLGQLPPSLPEVVTGTNLASTPYRLNLSIVAAITGLASAVAEALDIGSLDDNLTLPIISGGAIWTLFKFIEYIS